MFEAIASRLGTDAERRVAEYIAARADEIFEFTCDLIRTPSVNPPGDEVAVSRVIMDRLARLGVTDAEIAACEPHRPNVMAHVTGSTPGSTLMLSGHIDTKPPGNMEIGRAHV